MFFRFIQANRHVLSLLLFSCCVAACGSKKASSTSSTTDSDDLGAGTGTSITDPGLSPKTDAPENPRGIPTDGNAGSFEPHPAACSTCSPNPMTRVADCDASAFATDTCDGFCFVDPSVTPQWNTEPPSSGPAYPTYEYVGPNGDLDNNFHTEANPLARGYYVHNLAHGFVVIAYNCPDGCDDQLALIRDGVFHDHGSSGLIVTPDASLQGPRFAALAWTYSYRFDTVDSAALACFVKMHQGHPYCGHLPKASACTST